MTKKDYMKPELQVMLIQHQCQILAVSVQTTGLGDELSKDGEDPTGNAWDDALSRRSVWDDEKLLEDEEEEW